MRGGWGMSRRGAASERSGGYEYLDLQDAQNKSEKGVAFLPCCGIDFAH